MKQKRTRKKPWANTQIEPRNWFRIPNGVLQVGCCDCALVHDMFFRVRQGHVEIMVDRNSRETKTLRTEQFAKHKSKNGYYRIRVLSYKKD